MKKILKVLKRIILSIGFFDIILLTGLLSAAYLSMLLGEPENYHLICTIWALKLAIYVILAFM